MKNYILFGCVILCCGFTKVAAVSGVNGSDVQLLCPYRDTFEDKQIDWYKRYPRLRYFGGTKINPSLLPDLKSRLTVTGDRSKGEYHMSISDVRKSDEGTYECALTGTADAVTVITLTVITNIPSSLSIENVGLDKKLNGIEGNNLIIKCLAIGGYPRPDVKLRISDSDVATAKQNVQHTLSPVNRSYDGQNVTCLAGYEEISFYPLIKSAKIYLKLKPNIPTFSSDSVQTEETKPLVISCTSTGSRPKASIYWLLGDSKTNVTANSSETKHSHDQETDVHSVTSTLSYSVDRLYNRKHLFCGASNEVTSEQAGVVEVNKTLNITYAPNITVNSTTYTQNDADRTVTCNPSGNPEHYTYHKWQHKSKYGEFIREFQGNKTLKLPDAPISSRYQDSGEYVCTASNGIKDKYNRFEQTGSGLVTVRALPVLTSDTINRVKQFGEIGTTIDIYVDVYSVPQFTNFIWARDGTPITNLNSAKYESSSSPTILKDTIHGKKVQLDGFNVTLRIRDLNVEDFVNYTVTLKSGFPDDVKFTIVLESATVPEIPGNLSIGEISASSFTVKWDPNYGGGYKQTFYIQYRVQGSSGWTKVSAGDEDINEQWRRRTFEVTNLQEGTAYELRMYAENTAMKRSNVTEVLIAYTQSSAGPSVAAIIGGVAGGLTAIIIVLLVICFVQKKRKESGTPSTILRASSEEEDGLKDNILYESSQSDDLKKKMLYQSAGPNVETQKNSQTSSEYAVVQKPNAIYAEVNKIAQPKNSKEKKQKDKKEKPKKARKVKAKAEYNNPDDEYANSGLQMKNLNDEEYANSTDTHGTSGQDTHAQGLEYADLTFKQIPTKNKKQVIHGNDERTIYADVDHTKKAPPAPQESEYEETNIKHGKIAQ